MTPSMAVWLLQVRRPALPLFDRRASRWVTTAHPVTQADGFQLAEDAADAGRDARLTLHGVVYYEVAARSQHERVALPEARAVARAQTAPSRG